MDYGILTNMQINKYIIISHIKSEDNQWQAILAYITILNANILNRVIWYRLSLSFTNYF